MQVKQRDGMARNEAFSQRFQRTELLFGAAAMKRLAEARVAVFGVGGVGGYVVEVLARSGVGAIDLFDSDTVDVTNLNRQIIATESALGRLKTTVCAERIRSINSSCAVREHPVFYLPETADRIDLSCYDYVADCIDTITAKAELIVRCQRLGVPIISCMGAGRKLDASAFRVTDLADTAVDPLAKALRKRLRQAGILHVKTVCSSEPPLPIDAARLPEKSPGHPAPPSNAFVPAAAGIVAGGEVVRDLVAPFLDEHYRQ